MDKHDFTYSIHELRFFAQIIFTSVFKMEMDVIVEMITQSSYQFQLKNVINLALEMIMKYVAVHGGYQYMGRIIQQNHHNKKKMRY